MNVALNMAQHCEEKSTALTQAAEPPLETGLSLARNSKT
jgi:hypothetical protein